MTRSAVAIWRGGPGAGEGSVSTSSGVISNALYSFGSGTLSEPCTSPSEMLVAAVASCISVMVTQEMAKVGLKDDYVRTEAVLTFGEKKKRWQITGIQLNVTSNLPEVDAEKFQHAVRSARAKCPISRSLRVPIKVTTKLEPLSSAVAA